MLPTISADWLLARCKDNGEDCLIWTGAITPKGAPRARPPGTEAPQAVRRMIWAAMHDGKEPPANHFVRTTCGVWGCVEPSHIYIQHRTKVLAGRELPLTHRARIATAQRAIRAVLTREKVEAIKAADGTYEAKSDLFGVGKTTIAEICRGTRWRDYSNNPFAGLGA